MPEEDPVEIKGRAVSGPAFQKSPDKTILCLKRVADFAVLGQVETGRFILFAHPQAHNCIDYLQYNEGDHKGINPGGHHRQRLNAYLGAFPKKSPSLPAALMSFEAKKPVNSAPSVPPMP